MAPGFAPFNVEKLDIGNEPHDEPYAMVLKGAAE